MSKRIPLQQDQAHWFAKDYTTTARRVGFTQRKRLHWLVEDFASRLNYEALAPNLTPGRGSLAARTQSVHFKRCLNDT